MGGSRNDCGPPLALVARSGDDHTRAEIGQRLPMRIICALVMRVEPRDMVMTLESLFEKGRAEIVRPDPSLPYISDGLSSASS